MGSRLQRLILFVAAVYLILTCYTAYLLISNAWHSTREEPPVTEPSLYINHNVHSVTDLDTEDDWNPWGEEFEEDGVAGGDTARDARHDQPFDSQSSNVLQDDKLDVQRHETLNVEIWGKAAIGLYLWEHILDGKLQEDPYGQWSIGTLRVGDIVFTFRTGPGVTPQTIPHDAEYVVLVLNARSKEKIPFSREWLEFTLQIKQLRGLAVVLLGSERCHNEWFLPYARSDQSQINATFLVYDSPVVDNVRFFQWPLGVATYRNFPKLDADKVQPESHRQYICNYIGTVYANSSREELLRVMNKMNVTENGECLAKIRKKWEPQETPESLNSYINALLGSDLTLSPAGMNPECYRLYEALSCGSIPVVEEVSTPALRPGEGDKPAACDSSSLRLLRAYGAPIIYVSSWDELATVLLNEKRMSDAEKIARRQHVLRWYSDFMVAMRNLFVRTLKRSFLGHD